MDGSSPIPPCAVTVQLFHSCRGCALSPSGTEFQLLIHGMRPCSGYDVFLQMMSQRAAALGLVCHVGHPTSY